MGTRRAVIGVDVGGTKMLAGAVVGDQVVHSEVRATPRPDAGGGALTAALRDLLVDLRSRCEQDGVKVRAVGLAAAGFVDGAGERVAFAPHLAWRGEPVRAELGASLDLPVVLDNDANAALVAEHRWGAAQGASSALLVTLGTGIGGAVLTEGRLVRGATGMAGEFGHMCVVPGGRQCPCGLQGCWERYVSGTALVHAARKKLGEEYTDGRQVSAAAASGDEVALALLNKLGTWLGRGVANLVAAFDPEVVVIGGGLVRIGDALLDPARETLAERLVGGSHRVPPPLVPAVLGPEAGMRGAAALARDRVRRGGSQAPARPRAARGTARRP